MAADTHTPPSPASGGWLSEAEPLWSVFARRIALAGLGTTNGYPRKATGEWTSEAWEKRVLDCIPTEALERCIKLANELSAIAAARASRVAGAERALREHIRVARNLLRDGFPQGAFDTLDAALARPDTAPRSPADGAPEVEG